MEKESNSAAGTPAIDLVLSFIQALNEEDFEKAKMYIDENLHFLGVMGERFNATSYMDDMKKMKLKYEVLKTFGDGNDVSVFYNIDMGKATIFASGWYKIESGRIRSFKVLFDPRPLLS